VSGMNWIGRWVHDRASLCMVTCGCVCHRTSLYMVTCGCVYHSDGLYLVGESSLGVLWCHSVHGKKEKLCIPSGNRAHY
jgi:hypothetical protein